MLVNMNAATRMFLAGAAASPVLAAPMAVSVWTEPATGSINVTSIADPGQPGCTDATGAPRGPGTAGVSVPGANATASQGNASVSVPGAGASAGPGSASVSVPGAGASAGPDNASVSVPGAGADAGPGYFNGCINGWCWNAGG